MDPFFCSSVSRDRMRVPQFDKFAGQRIWSAAGSPKGRGTGMCRGQSLRIRARKARESSLTKSASGAYFPLSSKLSSGTFRVVHAPSPAPELISSHPPMASTRSRTRNRR